METTALTLHQHLRDPNWRVLLALMEDYGDLRERSRGMRGILRPKGGKGTRSQREDLLFALMAVPRIAGYGCRIQALLNRIRPEILFTHSGVEFLATARFCSSRAVWVAGVGSDVLRDILGKNPRQEKLIRKALRYLYSGPRCLVTASRGLANVLIDELEVKAENVEVIGNPIDLASLPAAGPRGDDLPAEFILGVGRLTGVKGFDVLIRAVAKMDHPVPLILLGEGEERARLEQIGRDVGCDLRMPGFSNDPYRYMRAARAVVVSSRLEGFSNVTLEAMACGTPVIVTDCPHGPREIVAEGKDGMLVPRDDVGAMAEGMTQLLTKPGLAAHYAKRGLARARDFDTPVIARRYFDLFDRLSP